jgi:two-component system, OmpR family, response regulator BaeR
MNAKILIVENEPGLAIVLQDYLRQDNFDTACLDNGLEVVPFVQTQEPDLILLDLMLPGKNGTDICREIRRFSNVPIIMVTARTDEIDRLLGLELGADDYICKPFSPREVVARVKTVLRRAGSSDVASHQELVLDGACHRATIAGQTLPLSTVEFKLLHLLATHKGRIYSRSQLMDEIYEDRRVVYDRTIDSHIKKLRKKIAEAVPDREFIFAVYGAGYKYDPN